MLLTRLASATMPMRSRSFALKFLRMPQTMGSALSFIGKTPSFFKNLGEHLASQFAGLGILV